MGMTYTERKTKAAQLKDSRLPAQKIAAAALKPKALDPPTPFDREIDRLERSKAERKLMKMDPESRRLEMLKEMRDREPAAVVQPHARLPKIESVIDAILSGDREYADYEFAVLVLAQHQPGMDPLEADRLWAALREQESNYLQGVRQGHLEKQALLHAELTKVNLALGDFVDTPPPNAYGILLNGIPTYGKGYGVGLSPSEYAEVQQAEGSPEAEAAVAQKHIAKVSQYLAGVEAENAGQTP